MPGTQPLPPKKEVALALLERSSVYVHLDPRLAAVVVPAWFKKQPQLILQVGLNMPVPIPDLRLDDEGLSCTLSFSRAAFYCVVPWASVFAMVGEDGRYMVWPEDIPAEVARQAQVRARVETPAEKEEAPKPAADKPVKVASAKPESAPRSAPCSGAHRRQRKPCQEEGPKTARVEPIDKERFLLARSWPRPPSLVPPRAQAARRSGNFRRTFAS